MHEDVAPCRVVRVSVQIISAFDKSTSGRWIVIILMLIRRIYFAIFAVTPLSRGRGGRSLDRLPTALSNILTTCNDDNNNILIN